MRTIFLKNVTKAFHAESVLDDVTLTVEGGSFFALLGPSGCGKTTLLRLIGGFEQVDSGSIWLGDENITSMPIHKRRVNTVFQNYALFPHMNVFDNVAYSLAIRRYRRDIIVQRVTRVLRTVRLENRMYKRIDQLSGGQQQRVALARAIINEPEVLLLDEPLAALDVRLREQMLIELIDLQDTLRTTFVYVTHDQSEALTVADQMAIMNVDGEIEQVGVPKEVYEFPATSFVANFVGKANIFQGMLRVYDQDPAVEVTGLGSLKVFVTTKRDWMVEGRSVLMALRPEKIYMSKTPLENFPNHLIGKVEDIVYHGAATHYVVRLKNDFLLQVFEQNEEHVAKETADYDDVVHLYWYKESAVLLSK